MLGSILIPLMFIAAAEQPQATLLQQSSGWCSPNIANVTGNVTVNCIGVDPRALKRLNAELSKKNLQLVDKIREADEWTKRYKDLESQLAQAGNDSNLSKQAEEYLHEGELEKAGTILDQILSTEEKQVDVIAANHYNRALVFELQFLPLDARPHLEKAYQYRPGEVKYGLEYSAILLGQNDFTQAEPVLLATLTKARELADADLNNHGADLANVLTNLGFGYYRPVGQMEKAEGALLKALYVYQCLTDIKSVAYERKVAETLNHLGMVQNDLRRLEEAENSYLEAEDVLRRSRQAQTTVYQLDLARIRNNLGNLYEDTHQFAKAETSFNDALETYKQFAKLNPAYNLLYAETLNNLANLHGDIWQDREADAVRSGNGAAYRDAETVYTKAVSEYQESLLIRRQLAQANPAAYNPGVSQTLYNLGVLYRQAGEWREAENTSREALNLNLSLMETSPAVFKPYVVQTLNNLALIDIETGNLTRANREIEESIKLGREIWQTSPRAFGDIFARTLVIAAQFRESSSRTSSNACMLLREAATAASDPDLRKIVQSHFAESCNREDLSDSAVKF